MANNIVAFVGYDSFDIILYLSRIFHNLDHKVLVADYSETSALTYSIPKVKGIDAKVNRISYRGVDFTRMPLYEEVINEYDDILMDCGYRQPDFDLSVLTKVIFVTDIYRFRIKRLKHIKRYDILPVKKELLIRGLTNIKISTDQMAALIGKQFKDDEIRLLNLNEWDYDNSVVCHYNQSFRFTRVSGTLKAYLLREAGELAGEITDKQLKQAYQKAKRGD